MDKQLLVALVTGVTGSTVTVALLAALLNRFFAGQIEVQKAFLARQSEELKAYLARESEVQKANLGRQSKVHEQQVTALRLIYANLKRASYFFQRLSAAMRLASETDEALYKEFIKNIVAASDLCLDNELLIPELLVTQLDAFFGKLQSAQIDLGFAMSPDFPSGEARAKLRDKAATVAFQELPPILKAINDEARRTIHVMTN